MNTDHQLCDCTDYTYRHSEYRVQDVHHIRCSERSLGAHHLPVLPRNQR